MSLYSGKRIHSYNWEEIPIHQDLIDRVEQLTRGGGQPFMDNNQPLLEWLPGKYIEGLHHDPIIQKEEEPHENQVNENEIEQQQERDQEEENYVTDIDTMGDK